MSNLGRAWEAQLRVWHQAYEEAGEAYIVHAPPPVRVLSAVKADGSFAARWWKTGPCDFIGHARGRSVVFDAKHCEGARWPLEKLEPHQALALKRATRAGAFAFVALRMGGEAFVVPWSELGPRWLAWAEAKARKVTIRGAASLSLNEVRAMATPMSDRGWIDAVPR